MGCKPTSLNFECLCWVVSTETASPTFCYNDNFVSCRSFDMARPAPREVTLVINFYFFFKKKKIIWYGGSEVRIRWARLIEQVLRIF